MDNQEVMDFMPLKSNNQLNNEFKFKLMRMLSKKFILFLKNLIEIRENSKLY